MPTTGLDGWRSYLETHDLEALADVLHPDVVFSSPVIHTPQHGRDITLKFVAGASAVLGGPAFRCVGEWSSPTGGVFEFETEVAGVTINGVDIIRLTEDGRQILDLKVMMRPLKAINLVHRLMGEQLYGAAAKAEG